MAWLSFMFQQYVNTHPEWSLSVGDPGSKLVREPPTLRGPDLGIVRVERVPKGKGAAGWLDGAPDFVIEIAGDSETTAELMRKGAEYFRAGARLMWILEPEGQNVIVLTPPDHVKVVSAAEPLDGAGVLEGFHCLVSDLFK
jgi:Uma2 family endonuclease